MSLPHITVPIYMPIPIPVPMPMGPQQGGGGKASYGGGGGGGEVRKIYVLQAIPQQHPNRGIKGGGMMQHPYPMVMHPQPPSSYESPVVRHRAPPTHIAKKPNSYGGGSHGDEGGLSDLGSKTQKNLIDSQLKILPIIVIPPIAPMGPIHLPQAPSTQTKHHSNSIPQIPKMTLTPQFNNYVLAPKSSPSNSNQFIDDMVPPNIAPFSDAKSFADYGGSTGGVYFKQTIGSRSRRRSRIASPPLQDISNDYGGQQRQQRTNNNRPTGDYDSIQSQIDEPPMMKNSYGPRQPMSARQIVSLRRNRQQQPRQQNAKNGYSKLRRTVRPQLSMKSEEFDEASQQHQQDFFDDEIEQDLDNYRQTNQRTSSNNNNNNNNRASQYDQAQQQFEQPSNGGFSQQQQENVASYTEPRQQVAQLEPPIFNDYDDIRPNRIQLSDDINPYNNRQLARQQQQFANGRSIYDNQETSSDVTGSLRNSKNQKYQQQWTRTRQPLSFYDDTIDSYDTGASVIDELRGLASVKSMSFANFTTNTNNNNDNATNTINTHLNNNDHKSNLTSANLMPIKQQTPELNRSTLTFLNEDTHIKQSNDATQTQSNNNVNSGQHHLARKFFHRKEFKQ